MKVIFSQHALRRMVERGIRRSDVLRAIREPDKVEVSRIEENRFLAKKVYRNLRLGKDHLLMVICERVAGEIHIVTVVDTSKISKYI